MQVYDDLVEIKNSSIALGFFDAIHLGHRVVLKNTVNIAKLNKTQSTVIIFKEHPLNLLTSQKVQLILTLEEKLEILKSLNVDNVVLLDFAKYSHIKAKDYLNILHKYFSPIAITTGFNHYFGFNKEGNSELIKADSVEKGYKYFEVPPFVVNDRVVSCSEIRNLISLADFPCANKLLGYNFFVNGGVVNGDKIASRIGFSSANIEYPTDKIVIPEGVYFVKVQVDGEIYNGVLNHGTSPTMNNFEQKTEVHILDFDGDIYGKNIKISFITKIRNQSKFSSIDELKFQIQKDITFVNVYKCFINKENI